jgi:hypothetical protein
MVVNGKLHASAALPRGKSPKYPLDRRLGGTQSRSGRCGVEKKSLSPAGKQTSAVLPVARHYTDWAIPAPPTNMQEC